MVKSTTLALTICLFKADLKPPTSLIALVKTASSVELSLISCLLNCFISVPNAELELLSF